MGASFQRSCHFSSISLWSYGFSGMVPFLRFRSAFQRVDVLQIVAFLVGGGFENEGLGAEFRMRQDAAEPLRSNIAFADILMAVEMRPQRAFGIVAMDDRNIFDSQCFIYFFQRSPQTEGRRDVVPGGEAVAGVDAESDLQPGFSRGVIAHGGKLGEAAAELIRRAGRILQ